MLGRVLVVDDEKALVLALKGLLKKEGHQVEVAYSGEEAIEKIEHAITNLDDPQRAGWFTSETADAAKRVLAGEG